MDTIDQGPSGRPAPIPPLIVAGMHRSGTSMMAALLSTLSLDMGRDLLAPDPHNVRGYFEDVEFLGLQRRMLSESCASDDGGHPDWGWTEHDSLDRGGFERFALEARSLFTARAERGAAWGWKDPRTTLLLDFWDGLLEGARYVFVYRFPWDVADSMQRLGADVFLRNPEYAYRIWEHYNRHLRDFYVAHPHRCVLVSSNALPGNLQAFTRAVRDKLGVHIREAEGDEVYDDELLKTIAGTDPLIDLFAAVWPRCAHLLSELDELADISGAALWRARPVRSRLARPDAADGAAIDVSVVTPCYEQGPLLVEAIASAERTAPDNCELVIVNDGSSQRRTLEILDTLKGLGYYVRDQANLGLSAARNAAIAVARGRYVLPLDDDNRLRAGFIRDAIQVLDSHPDVGVVYGDRNDFGLHAGIREIAEFDARKLLDANYIDACAVFRREIWVACGGYDPSVSPLEDWELWIQAVKRGWRFHHLPYVTFDYRVRPGSLLAAVANSKALEEELHQLIRNKHADVYRSLARAVEGAGAPAEPAVPPDRAADLESPPTGPKSSRVRRLLESWGLVRRTSRRPKLPLEIVVVFNEPDTLEGVFLRSAGLADATLVLVDNRERAAGLPTLFNEHKRRSRAEWLVFCHQDFVVFDPDWVRRVVALPPSACYGPIGRDASLRWRGQITQTDGSLLGEPAPLAEVVGVDEMCLVVPRDVYTRVDFDEGFPFDLYVHDYCLAARRLGYPIRIVDLACQHRSKTLTGEVASARFLAAQQRFIDKHAGVLPLVTSTFHVLS